MFGSGENTVAPTSDFPSRSFCLAVLKMRTGVFSCCVRAPASAITPNASEITPIMIECRARIALLLEGRIVVLMARHLTPHPTGCLKYRWTWRGGSSWLARQYGEVRASFDCAQDRKARPNVAYNSAHYG